MDFCGNFRGTDVVATLLVEDPPLLHLAARKNRATMVRTQILSGANPLQLSRDTNTTALQDAFVPDLLPLLKCFWPLQLVF